MRYMVTLLLLLLPMLPTSGCSCCNPHSQYVVAYGELAWPQDASEVVWGQENLVDDSWTAGPGGSAGRLGSPGA